MSSPEKNIYAQNNTKADNALTKCVLNNRVIESNSTFSLYFTDNSGLMQKYVPGQYVSIKVPLGNNQHQFRQYSISDTPTQNQFRVTIKREEAIHGTATVSNTLFNNAELNTSWELSHPSGNFSIVNTHKPIVLLSVGIGITPVFSMLKQLLATDSTNPILFIHLTENSDFHTFKHELYTLEDKRLNKHIVYSNPKTADIKGIDYSYAGFFDFSTHTQFIFPDADYYLCGNPQFVRSMRQELTEHGVSISSIYVESFEPDAYN